MVQNFPARRGGLPDRIRTYDLKSRSLVRYPATLRAGIVLNSQEFAARALTFVIIDVSLQVLTVISELAIFRKRNAESCAFSRPFA